MGKGTFPLHAMGRCDKMVSAARPLRREVRGVRWYWIALLVCLVIGPFDALYVYIKAQKRRDELKRREQERKTETHGEDDAP